MCACVSQYKSISVHCLLRAPFKNTAMNLNCECGCDKTNEEVTTGGLVCPCGVVRPLRPGQVCTGKKERDHETRQNAENMRQDQFDSFKAPIKRVIHLPHYKNCRVCTVRCIDQLASNRIAAKWAKQWISKVFHDEKNTRNIFLSQLEVNSKFHLDHIDDYFDKSMLRKNGALTIKRFNDECLAVCIRDSKFVSDLKEECLLRLYAKGSKKNALKTAFEDTIKVCNSYKNRALVLGENSAKFVLDKGNSDGIVRLDPMLKRTGSLYGNLSIRKATCIQSVAESMLESIVNFEGLKYGKEIASKLSSKTVDPHTIADLLNAKVTDTRYSRGAVRIRRRRDSNTGEVVPGEFLSTFLYCRRMCCDNDECKEEMRIGGKGLFEESIKDKDGFWNVETRLLGAFAICVSKIKYNNAKRDALRMTELASKELFLHSRFFQVRQSTFIATCTSLIALGCPISDVDSEKQIKRDLSLQAIAISMGFWPMYVKPCFDVMDQSGYFNEESIPHTQVETLHGFVQAVDRKMTDFEYGKGNAAIDAILCYRHAIYRSHASMSTDRSLFYSQVTFDNGASVYLPTLPQSVFGKNVHLPTFSVYVQKCMRFASDASKANSSIDNELVRTHVYSHLSYNDLLAAINRKELGASSQKRALPNGFSDAVPREYELDKSNILDLVDSAANRVELTLGTTFWENTFDFVDFGLVKEHTKHHVLGSLLKRIDDNTHYNYEASSTESTANNVADLKPLKPKNDDVKSRVARAMELEAGLSVLMNGTNCISAPVRFSSVVSVDQISIASLGGSNSRPSIVKLYDVQFIKSVVQFIKNSEERLKAEKKKSENSKRSRLAKALDMAKLSGQTLLTKLIGDIRKEKLDFENCLNTAQAIHVKFTETEFSGILTAIKSFYYAREALLKRVEATSYSTENSTKTPGVHDSCVFLKPISNWFDSRRSCNWDVMNDAIRLIKTHSAEVKRQAAENAKLSVAKRSYLMELDVMYENEKTRLKAEWDLLPHDERAPFEEIAVKYRDTGVSGFQVSSFRGILAFVVWDPEKLYSELTGTISSPELAHLLNLLVKDMISLNIGKKMEEDLRGFHRHPMFVKFLCKAGILYGTPREKRKAKAILVSGYSFFSPS